MFIYLSEFCTDNTQNGQVYKIDKSDESKLDTKLYKSTLLFCIKMTEPLAYDDLLKLFHVFKFTNVEEYGENYFIGDYKQMINTIIFYYNSKVNKIEEQKDDSVKVEKKEENVSLSVNNSVKNKSKEEYDPYSDPYSTLKKVKVDPSEPIHPGTSYKPYKTYTITYQLDNPTGDSLISQVNSAISTYNATGKIFNDDVLFQKCLKKFGMGDVINKLWHISEVP
jgi:hypothetical protein